jgi:predicted HAD superfamily hydrolase
MTDTHDNDDNTLPRGNERTEFDLNPDYNEYGVETLDDGVVILRIDSKKHLFERVGAIRCKQTGVSIQRYIKGETLEDEGSFRTVESVSVGQEKFESQLQDEIVELIYEGKVDEEQARSLAESVAESISEQYR